MTTVQHSRFSFTPTGVYSASKRNSGAYYVSAWVEGHGTVLLGLVKKVGNLPSMQGWHAFLADDSLDNRRYRTRNDAASALLAAFTERTSA